MRGLAGVALFTVSLAGSACGEGAGARQQTEDRTVRALDTAALRRIIQGKNDQFAKAHVTGQRDSAAMVNYYTDDGKIFPPNAEVVVGRRAIETLVSQYMQFDISDFREENTALYGGQDYLIDEGTYSMTYGSANTVETGKYVNVWKKVNGEWKVFTNIWNANPPGSPQ